MGIDFSNVFIGLLMLAAYLAISFLASRMHEPSRAWMFRMGLYLYAFSGLQLFLVIVIPGKAHSNHLFLCSAFTAVFATLCVAFGERERRPYS